MIDALQQAARALDYLNALTHAFVDAFSEAASQGPGVAHGDVAPRSILYVGGGVKLADIDPLHRVSLAHNNSKPPAAPFIQTTRPERLAGRTSRHSDQFSLALTYGHLLTGRPITPRDLANLPATERPALARALDPDPARVGPRHKRLSTPCAERRNRWTCPRPKPFPSRSPPGNFPTSASSPPNS